MPEYDFDGDTYDPDRDQGRLQRQYLACYALMSDHRWWTLAKLSRAASARIGRHVSEASASARLRDMRKERFGSHTVEREYLSDGLWQYRLLSDRD